MKHAYYAWLILARFIENRARPTALLLRPLEKKFGLKIQPNAYHKTNKEVLTGYFDRFKL